MASQETIPYEASRDGAFRGCPIMHGDADHLLPPHIGKAPPGSRPPKGEDYYTLPNGAPIRNPLASQRIGSSIRSTLLLQDINLIDVISHITHERIPERLVHAKGTSAYGEFEVTHDISDITSAAFLNQVGKKTPLFVRFSTVAGEKGSADSVRDARGFAFKLYTEEGNLDCVFFSTPVFQIRDPAKFPSLVHSQKREPASNLKDPTMFWDYFNRNAEGYNFLMYLFSDMGTPVSYRFADIFSINTYAFTKPNGSFKYVKIYLKTNQGVHDLKQDESVTISGKDPDYFQRDIYDSIQKGNYPSWTVYAQVIDPKDAQNYPINIFDATKVIPEKDFPMIPFGKITLNGNTRNFFAESEQSAFNPANIVPGWDITPDPIIQIRLFAYGDTQRYRLGVNFSQLPINRSFYAYQPTKRDGAATFTNYGDLPNYIPNTGGPKIIKAAQYEDEARDAHEEFVGRAVSFESATTADDLVQPREFWQNLANRPDGQKNFVYNVAVDLYGAETEVRYAAYGVFKAIDPGLGEWIEKATEEQVKENTPLEEIPGVVVGGKTANPTPPTLPAPSTQTEHNVFHKIHKKFESTVVHRWL